MSIKDLCNFISEHIGPCPKCGKIPAVIAVYENNQSDEIIGFKVICECSLNGKEYLTQQEIASLKTYTFDEVKKLFID